MKVYLAAPYAARDYLREVAPAVFQAGGHELVSGWLQGTRPISEGTVGTSPDSPTEEVAHHAALDLAEVTKADALVMLTGEYISQLWGIPDEYLHTGGRHVELGYALAAGIRCIVVGPAENIFQRTLCSSAHSLGEAADLLDGPPPLPAGVAVHPLARV